VSSLSEQERLGLDDVFLSLGKKTNISEKLKEQTRRSMAGLFQVSKKSLPMGISYISSKKNNIKQHLKRADFKLFHYFIPKNRGSK